MMKLLIVLLLLLLLLAALLPPSQGDAVWNEQLDPDRAGALRYLEGKDSYGRAAAARAAAAAGKADDADTAGRGYDHRRQQLPIRYTPYHKRHYGSSGCGVKFHPVESLMGDAATECAECLTTTAIFGGMDGHDSYDAHGGKKCRDVCDFVPRGSEFFVPLPTNLLVTKCKPGDACYQGKFSTSACQCCGRNLGMDYNMPPSSPSDFLGEVSNFRRSCAEPVSANNCQACLLWRKLRGGYFQGNLTSLPCTQGERCFVTKDRTHTLMGTAIVHDPYHYLLLPGSSQADWSVIGIEDPLVLTRRIERIWDLAWKLAFKPYSQLPFTAPFSVPDLPVANHSCRIGLALNPASARSQHQMHIHIARIPTPLRQLFVGRRKNYKEWTKVKVPITKQKYTSWPVVYARYFPLESIFTKKRHGSRRHRDNDDDDDTSGEGFGFPRRHDKKDNETMGMDKVSDYRIFRQAFNFARKSFLRLQAWGILIIPDEESIYLRDEHAPLPRGFYLVLSTNNAYGTWNSYRATAVNANFSPELLLCTSYSTGGGKFWKPEECYTDILARTDTAPGLRATFRAGESSRFTDGFVAQQAAQDWPLDKHKHRHKHKHNYDYNYDDDKEDDETAGSYWDVWDAGAGAGGYSSGVGAGAYADARAGAGGFNGPPSYADTGAGAGGYSTGVGTGAGKGAGGAFNTKDAGAGAGAYSSGVGGGAGKGGGAFNGPPSYGNAGAGAGASSSGVGTGAGAGRKPASASGGSSYALKKKDGNAGNSTRATSASSSSSIASIVPGGH